MSNSQLNNLKSGIKNGAEVTLNILSSLIRNSDDEYSSPHKLLITNTQISKLLKLLYIVPQLYKVIKNSVA